MTVSLFSAEHLDRLQQVCVDTPQILAVFLFGSHVDGYATLHSDVDLAILLNEPLTLLERLALEVAFCQALEWENVDILWLADAAISLKFRAISGQLLYEQNPARVSDFIQRTMVEYYDFQHILKTYEREFIRSLEQDYDL